MSPNNTLPRAGQKGGKARCAIDLDVVEELLFLKIAAPIGEKLSHVLTISCVLSCP